MSAPETGVPGAAAPDGVGPSPVVAHCGRQFFAGSETFIYFYLSRLRAVRPICIATGSPELVNTDQFPFPEEDFYGVPRRSRRRSALYAGIRFHLGAALRRVPRLSTRLRRAEVDHRWITSVLRGRDARLIHAHYGPTGWDLLPVKRELRIALVTTFYGYDTAPEIELEGAGWADRRLELFEEGDLFLAEGPAMREKLVTLGCPAEKIQIQRIAIPLGERSPPGRPDERSPVRVVFAGRLVEKKGLEYALEAVRSLLASGVSLELRVIGDGPLMGEAKRFVQAHGLESSVRLLGFVPHAELVRELRGADIFLHPSVTAGNGDSEGGAPTVILEAQAMGVPVVATRHADIPYVTIPGVSALLSEERDSESLAASLRSLIDDPARRAEMGAAGARHVRAHHDIDTEARSLERKYLQLLEPSNA